MRVRLRSLPVKLALASAAVAVIMSILLIANSVRVSGRSLREQVQVRLDIVRPLLRAALAAPLAEHDYATLHDILTESQRRNALDYLVLHDRRGVMIAAAGWDARQPLPALNAPGEFDDPDGRFDTRMPIQLAGQDYGELQIGMSLAFLAATRAALYRDSVVIGLVTVTLTTTLLVVLGFSLTRPLRRLTDAGDALRRGETGVRVPVTTRDETGFLTHTFNAMAEALEDRMSAVRASEARYRLLVEGTQAIVWEADPNTWQFTFVSPRGETVTGYRPEEWYAPRFWADHIHPDDRDAAVDFCVTCTARGEAHTFEYRMLTADGRAVWIRDVVSVEMADGKPARLVGLMLDVTERKRAEEALQEARGFLQEVVDQSPSMIFVKDADGRAVFVNRYFAQYYGTPRKEIIAKTTADVHRQTGEALKFMSDDQEVLRTRQKIVREELNTAPNGEKHWFHTVKVPLLRPDGRVDVLGISTDITERRNAEARRVELESQVRQAQKLESLGVLAGGVAHDFNNILGAILGNVELARQDVDAGHPAQESLAEIRKAGLRGRDLIQQILTFSRQQKQERHAIQPRTVLEDCVKLLRFTLPAGIELATACAADTPNILADRTQIQQVIMNLCTNAWQALEGRTGRIDVALDGATVTAEEASLDADLRPGRYARLAVTDNGKGMDAATLARIFDPFFTTKALGEGTGLGLAVVHGIVKRHNGVIRVRSEPGRGTVFQVYFPAVAAEAEARPAEPVHLPRGSGQRILFLDDEEALGLIAARLLERLGYQVSPFTAPADALTAFRSNPDGYDVLVTDYNMPGMSGLEVAREVLRVRPDLPIALTSGYMTDELRDEAVSLGIDDVIYKPNTTVELVQTIHRLLVDVEAGSTR